MKKKFMIVFVLLVGILMTACSKDGAKDFEFVRDESLDVYTKDNYIIENIKKNIFGATGPQIAYLNDDYAVISHHAVMFIYDFNSESIKNTIDTKSMGLNAIQGDPHTNVLGYENYIAIYNDDAEDTYIYSIDDNALMKISSELMPENFKPNENAHSHITYGYDKYNDSHTDTYLYKDKLYILRNLFNTTNLDIEVWNSSTEKLEKTYIVFDTDIIANLNLEWGLSIDNNSKILVHEEFIESPINSLGGKRTYTKLSTEKIMGLTYSSIDDIDLDTMNRITEIEQRLNISEDDRINFDEVNYYSVTKIRYELDGVKYIDKCYVLVEEFTTPNEIYIIEDFNLVEDETIQM